MDTGITVGMVYAVCGGGGGECGCFFHCFRSCRHRRDGGGGGRVCGERSGYRVQDLGQGAWWESKAAQNGIGLFDPL